MWQFFSGLYCKIASLSSWLLAWYIFLASSLDKAKPILNMAIEKGHEIALHGLNHDSPLAMTKNEFIQNISKAKHKLEHELNIKIKGYRAPCFGINDDLVTALK